MLPVSESRPARKGADRPRLHEKVAHTGTSGMMFAGNLAVRVWELLDDHRSLHEIAATVSREFSLPRELAFEETCGYMRLFCEGDLVRVTR